MRSNRSAQTPTVPAKISGLIRHSVGLVLAALTSAFAGCGSATDRTLEETVEKVYRIDPIANITISNENGAIFVYGSTRNEMRVEAVKKAYSRERLKQLVINFAVQRSGVSISTISPAKSKSFFSDRSGTVDYTIVVPATANISKVTLNTGELLVDGMRGETVEARLGSGRIFAHNCFSNIAFTLGTGTITLAYEWWEKRRFWIQANIGEGNARTLLPADAACHLIAETGHGKIGVDFEQFAGRGSKETRKLDTVLGGGGEARITIRAQSGNIAFAETSP